MPRGQWAALGLDFEDLVVSCEALLSRRKANETQGIILTGDVGISP